MPGPLAAARGSGRLYWPPGRAGRAAGPSRWYWSYWMGSSYRMGVSYWPGCPPLVPGGLVLR